MQPGMDKAGNVTVVALVANLPGRLEYKVAEEMLGLK
jgi:hypothetical protein